MPAEHVELGDDEAGEPVDARGVAQRDQVEPAAAALAAGGGAVLVPALEHVPAGLVVELGRERPVADARRVGLRDAPDLVDLACGPTPAPTQAAPATGLDEVTNG